MTDAKTLAQHLLYLLKTQMGGLPSEEFDVTPLKLQKLLYYCQGYALALTGKPLFPEPIEAWKYGPVVDDVYQEYKRYGGGNIPYEQVTSPKEVDEVTDSVAHMVANEKGRLSGIALANATHEERPWKDVFAGAYTNKVIPVELMKDFFTKEFLRWEEPEDEEDTFWLSAGRSVTDADVEAALASL